MGDVRFHLILSYYPHALNPDDFHRIAEIVHARAPDIEVFVIADTMEASPDEARAISKPFLLVSPTILKRFRPSGGKIYSGRQIAKLDQMTLLRQRGIPVPKWQVIEPGTRLSEEDWGPIVVVKPLVGSFSVGVEARLTRETAYRMPQSFPAGHPGRRSPLMAQRFIDTGPTPAQIRVLTLFGVPLYAEEIRAEVAQKRPETLTAEALKDFRITPTTGPRIRAFVYDREVLDLARRTYGVFPDVPLHACDILREWGTGKLYVLEINPGGNTWHFSSKWGQFQRVGERRRQDQFGAFEIAADILIERTRAEAR